MSSRSCAKCGDPLPEASGRGRPQTFCDTGCRRAAEYERRRLERRLERLEGIVASYRHDVAHAYSAASRKHHKKQVEWYQSELDAAERRLHDLLQASAAEETA